MQKRLPLPAGELGALIGMHHDLPSGLSSPNSHQQSLQSQVLGHSGLRRPADHAAREQVDEDTQIQPTLVGLDMGDVGYPDLIGGRSLFRP